MDLIGQDCQFYVPFEITGPMGAVLIPFKTNQNLNPAAVASAGKMTKTKSCLA